MWRSLEERSGDAELAATLKQEFPDGADQMPEDSVSRRGFMKLLSTTMAVTGVACTRPNQKIIPYVKRPPEVTPGNSLHFATAYALEGYGSGFLVESHAGRPTKIEGNPDHPESRGKGTPLDQALILGLFDDDRAKQLRHKGSPVAWRTLLGELATRGEALAVDGGAKLRFLVEPDASPLLADLKGRILSRFPKAKFVTFSSVAADGAVQGAHLAFGKYLEPRHNLEKASVIFALDADFLADGPEQLPLARHFAARRAPGADMNRLYAAEPCPTVTGSMADHRLRVRGSEIVGVAQLLVSELARQGVDGLGPVAALPKVSASAVDARWVVALAKDLAKNRGTSLVIAGRRQPAAVHALCHVINQALGNVGVTVSYWAPKASEGLAGFESLREFVNDVAAGQVDTLVITARNPVYGAPVDFKFAKLLQRVPVSLYFSLYDDETAAAVTTVIPAAHALESWGDTRALDGTVSIVQPLIHPLWSGLTAANVFAAFVPGEADKGAHQLLQEFWKRKATELGLCSAESFDIKWEVWLGKGVIEGTASKAEDVTGDLSAAAGAIAPQLQALAKVVLQGDDLEMAFAVDNAKLFDGRFANNAWLQELPHPVSKITWENAIYLSPATAAKLGLQNEQMAHLEAGDRQVNGAVYIQPGHVDDAITVALGYAPKLGQIARAFGFNAGVLRRSEAPWFDGGVKLSKFAKAHKFGQTQLHWRMEGRDPVLVDNLAEFQKHDSEINKKLEHRRGPLPSLHEPVDYSKAAYKWGMAIDLSKCTGCGACVVACQSENNIPVVGPENVRIGREMQWIRLDRYYEGDENDPQMVTQPVMCLHCETAPCEYVCPVNATVHSDEGLNEMAYNRCVGTRYCSNNCPYKARRFNFLDYHQKPTAVAKMATNPDVTVRARGIMEKCTYCVQRIERARIDTRLEGRTITDSDLQSACQQVCPSGAIEFGTLNDANSKVSRAHADARRYDLLHDLNTRPRTAYLARVRNPNPELA